MTDSLGAMAAWFPATPMSQHQRPGQSVWGNPQARQKRAFATLQRSGRGLGGRRWLIHLIVIIRSDYDKNKTKSKCSKQARSFADHNLCHRLSCRPASGNAGKGKAARSK